MIWKKVFHLRLSGDWNEKDGKFMEQRQADNTDKRKDRIEKYLQKKNAGILFDELADPYLKNAGIFDILHQVPVPIVAGVGGDELTTLTIALGMARVLGADTNFRYREQYLAYMKRLFGDKMIKVIISEGAKAGGEGNFELACMFFRAALLLDPKSRDALYLYGRACKDVYETEGQEEEYVGNFKAESLEIFELLTMIHPDFAMGYYFLGYGYANLGLYLKAQLTWETFQNLTAASGDEEIEELRDEIAQRLKSLEEPVRIEEGINHILSGDFQGGIEKLSTYTEGAYAKWWPLWYYLAVAEASLGNAENAIKDYRQALVYSPSNTDVMEELIVVYEAVGDYENARKYRNKIEIIKQNIKMEKQEN